ncbi:MAG: FAD-dependent oxidoreductase [Gammaproteobacteria bacterium]|nr:FAD-dependent oxidoreductase [Gammaproteobacteria bacterium]
MSRNPRYDILFEPVRIGPVEAKNRFYQVPHCNGMGNLRPRMIAEMRGMKAEGGWGVVCTEYCSIHPSSDDMPHIYSSLWDQADIKAQALMTEKVHEHGALAGVELWAGGAGGANLMTREVPMGVSSMPNGHMHPYQTRPMDLSDIRKVRRWHRDAALRAREAGFDIVYIYATHFYLLSQFLSPIHNQRTDEYGGSVENRVRLVRELIEETKDAIGDTCAIAVRMSADDGTGTPEQPVSEDRRAMFEILGELPDLWDVNIENYEHEMGVSRFIAEASLESTMNYVKSMTSKPVVSVGRFTSPDTMVSQVRRGIVDFVGAARPSIADPFIPRKIEEGRIDDIRECIGCNICYTGDSLSVPIRCTQNPTMGEEWRRGWHPERIQPCENEANVLVIGSGPAGLEATRALGLRGYDVMLAEASTELGGRVTRESRMPGLAEWARVRNYRVHQIKTMPDVHIFLDNHLSAEDALSIGAEHIVVATGATWRRDGFGHHHRTPCQKLGPAEKVFTPDDIFEGRMPEGKVLVFDDDHYYMGSVMAEALVEQGAEVCFVTTENSVSAWGKMTDEHYQVQQRLIQLGIEIITAHGLEEFDGKQAQLSCVYTEAPRSIEADAVVMVTTRTPNDDLYQEIAAKIAAGLPESDPVPTLDKIGDCNAPAIIAAAVYAGHRYARELGPDGVSHDVGRQDKHFVPD